VVKFFKAGFVSDNTWRSLLVFEKRAKLVLGYGKDTMDWQLERKK
jgi:hypothetical protein